MADDASYIKIEWLPHETLRADPRNARKHPKAQLRQLAQSIEVHGFNNPILASVDGIIIAGHARWEAAKILGLPNIPVIRLSHLGSNASLSYGLADNRIAENARWDKQILALDFKHLLTTEPDYDVSITGFDIAEVDLLLQPTDQIDDELWPALQEVEGPAVTRLGDLWRLGRHRMICGSALEATPYEVLMQGARANMVFTDPPYNVPVDGHVSGKGRNHHREFAMASGEMSSEQFLSFLMQSFTLLANHSHDGSLHFVCMDWRHAWELLSAGKTTYRELKNICVWVKHNAGMGSLWRSQHELVFVFKHGHGQHRNNVQLGQYGRHRTNVWNYPGVNNFGRPDEEGNLPALHPTVKPTNLVADAILDCSARGDIVLDAFLGSGTTLMAAERVGRICYGLELDPLYVDLIIRRWQRSSGERAFHAKSGQSFDDRAVELAVHRD